MPTPQEDYRTIPLTQGQVAIVDTADYEWLMQWKWFAQWCQCTNSFYARRNEWAGVKKQATVHMSRVILSLERSDKRCADHINRDTLDNRRVNLRPATRSQNGHNRIGTSKSGFKGVYRRAGKNVWSAVIYIEGKRKRLGDYPSPEKASDIYQAKARELRGEFHPLIAESRKEAPSRPAAP